MVNPMWQYFVQNGTKQNKSHLNAWCKSCVAIVYEQKRPAKEPIDVEEPVSTASADAWKSLMEDEWIKRALEQVKSIRGEKLVMANHILSCQHASKVKAAVRDAKMIKGVKVEDQDSDNDTMPQGMIGEAHNISDVRAVGDVRMEPQNGYADSSIAQRSGPTSQNTPDVRNTPGIVNSNERSVQDSLNIQTIGGLSMSSTSSTAATTPTPIRSTASAVPNDVIDPALRDNPSAQSPVTVNEVGGGPAQTPLALPCKNHLKRKAGCIGVQDPKRTADKARATISNKAAKAAETRRCNAARTTATEDDNAESPLPQPNRQSAFHNQPSPRAEAESLLPDPQQPAGDEANATFDSLDFEYESLIDQLQHPRATDVFSTDAKDLKIAGESVVALADRLYPSVVAKHRQIKSNRRGSPRTLPEQEVENERLRYLQALTDLVEKHEIQRQVQAERHQLELDTLHRRQKREFDNLRNNRGQTSRLEE